MWPGLVHKSVLAAWSDQTKCGCLPYLPVYLCILSRSFNWYGRLETWDSWDSWDSNRLQLSAGTPALRWFPKKLLSPISSDLHFDELPRLGWENRLERLAKADFFSFLLGIMWFSAFPHWLPRTSVASKDEAVAIGEQLVLSSRSFWMVFSLLCLSCMAQAGYASRRMLTFTILYHSFSLVAHIFFSLRYVQSYDIPLLWYCFHIPFFMYCAYYILYLEYGNISMYSNALICMFHGFFWFFTPRSGLPGLRELRLQSGSWGFEASPKRKRADSAGRATGWGGCPIA